MILVLGSLCPSWLRPDKHARRSVVAMLSVCFLLTSVACVAPPLQPLGETRTATTLEADEQALWKESRELQYKIAASGLLFEDPVTDAYLAQVLLRVTPPEIRAAGIEPRIEVISNVNIDGYSFANGVLYIHTALLSHMQDETQLATLISRELAHVVHRHALRAKRDRRASADTLAWIGVGTTLIEGGGNVKLLAQAASITSAVGFHHTLETTADAKGLSALDAAGYAVGSTPAFYEMTLAYLAEVHSQGVWGWWPFAPPPQITARIAGMKSLIASTYPNQRATRGPLADAQTFRRKIHSATIRQADLELAAGLFVSAEGTARLATASNAQDAKAWILLGKALMGQRLKPIPNREGPPIEDVRAAYQEARRIDPRNAEATRALGMSYFRKTPTGRTKEDAREALQYLRAYERLAPNATDIEYIRSYIEELQAETR